MGRARVSRRRLWLRGVGALSVSLLLIATAIAVPLASSGGGTKGAAEPAGPAEPADGVVRVTVEPGSVTGSSDLALGVTHTQHSLDPWGDDEAIARGERLLRFATYHNQHIYGWGAGNPQPQPGVMDWRTLDRRMRTIRRLGGRPIITLCCAPDWMTRLGTTTSTFPNLPPTPDHYDDFAELARQVAERYPYVRHFMVWNELKGFYSPRLRNWDYRAYTELYNRVYRALKQADPRNKVGGPYIVLEGTGAGDAAPASRATADPITARDELVIDHWLANKAGADFIAVDRKVQSKHDRNSYSRRDLIGFTHWFEDVTRQLRAKTRLPVVFAEDYFAQSADRRFVAAGLAEMLAAEIRGGASVSLRWGPQAEKGDRDSANGQSLFTDTRHRGGGRPLPAWRVYRDVARWFGRGTELVRASADSDAVGVLASEKAVLLINRTDRDLDVQVEKGANLTLPPWGVRIARLR